MIMNTKMLMAIADIAMLRQIRVMMLIARMTMLIIMIGTFMMFAFVMVTVAMMQAMTTMTRPRF